MENYLKGRGFKNSETEETNSFRGLLDPTESEPQNLPIASDLSGKATESNIIYEEKDCPKVEVISVDGRPSSIVIHLPDGRLLEIECQY
jgi:hypothetical protein